jgi:mono/diheme cytochrome c family protein
MKLMLVVLAGALFGTAVLPDQNDELEKSIARGKEVYVNYCIACHMGNGGGIPEVYPPLAKSDYLMKTPEKAIHAIKFGLQGPIKVNGVAYDGVMPEPGLDADEVADVMNYIRNSWGNSSEKQIVTVDMVNAVPEKPKK